MKKKPSDWSKKKKELDTKLRIILTIHRQPLPWINKTFLISHTHIFLLANKWLGIDTTLSDPEQKSCTYKQAR